tara:strand:+ start:2148 stop:2936 length:789 start_codon:yes stop_codon:yes gene_type:complete
MTQNFPGPVESSTSIRLDLRSWPEVDQYLSHCKGIILPIGSTEQHGPTGAIGTDALTAEAIALEVGKRSGVLVAPTQSFGMAQHHLGFAGTMSLQPSTLLAVLHDLLLSLARNGFERIFVVNGHGGNIATTKAAFAQTYSSAIAQQLPVASKLRCKVSSWFMVSDVYQTTKHLYGDQEGQHATPSEIALTFHLEPSLISKKVPLDAPNASGPIYGSEDFRTRYPDGRMGSNPFLASPEHGELLLEKASNALTNELKNFLEML